MGSKVVTAKRRQWDRHACPRRRQCMVEHDARLDRAELGYWRTVNGEEVDFVIEEGKSLLPIEIKAGARPRLADAAHLRSFRAEYGKRARAALLLHTGTTLEWLAPTTATDGSPLTHLVGYRIYYGTDVTRLQETIDVRNPGVLTYVVENLTPGTYYFAVTALTATGESRRSNAGTSSL